MLASGRTAALFIIGKQPLRQLPIFYKGRFEPGEPASRRSWPYSACDGRGGR